MKSRTHVATLIIALALFGCDDAGTPTDPVGALAPEASRAPGVLSQDHCVNFEYSTVGGLGVYEDPLNPGSYLFGAMPTPFSVAGMDGILYSFVDAEYISGGKQQGAHHILLHHHFTAEDGSWFQTNDRASCSPRAGEGCRVNDQMRVAEGEGVFANPDGVIQNHGIVDIPAGWIELNMRGRVCGDGI